MAKGVLGNDPFRKGAATRTPEDTPAEVAPSATPARKPKRKTTAKTAAPKAPAKAATPKKPRRKKAAAPAAEPVSVAEAQPEAEDDQVAAAAAEKTVAVHQEVPDVVPQEVPSEPEPVLSESAAPPSVALEPPYEEADEDLAEILRAEQELEEDEAPDPDLAELRAAARDLASAEAGELGASVAHSPRPPLERAAGALALAREVAAQTLRTDTLGRLARVADGVFTAVMTGLGASGSEEVDAYGKDARLARKLSPISDFFYDRYWRVTVEGAPHVPAGASILAANHSGALPVDGFILHQALGRERPDLPEARWLAEDQIFHAPFVGTLYNRLGAIRASPENAVRLLEEGRPVITFPEGVHGIRKTYAERYRLKRLGRGGFAKLAIRRRVPIVPVAIVGAEEAMPLLGKLPGGVLGLPYIPLTLPPLPARWLIRFAEPIEVDTLPPEAADDLLAVQRLVERTREAIEGMLKALLDARRSVFAG